MMTTRDTIAMLLSVRPMTTKQLAAESGRPEASIRRTVADMKRRGAAIGREGKRHTAALVDSGRFNRLIPGR